jgi:ankyrin repeat protein
MKDYINTIMDIVRHESPRLLKQYLMQNPNWDLMEKGFNNYTPIMEAVSVERLEMVIAIFDYLKSKHNIRNVIEHLNQVSSDGKNAVLIATCMNHQTEVLEYLISNGANYSIKDYSNMGVTDYAILSPSELIENFWSNFDPKKYEKIIQHNIDANSIRKRAGSNKGLLM